MGRIQPVRLRGGGSHIIHFVHAPSAVGPPTDVSSLCCSFPTTQTTALQCAAVRWHHGHRASSTGVMSLQIARKRSGFGVYRSEPAGSMQGQHELKLVGLVIFRWAAFELVTGFDVLWCHSIVKLSWPKQTTMRASLSHWQSIAIPTRLLLKLCPDGRMSRLHSKQPFVWLSG